MKTKNLPHLVAALVPFVLAAPALAHHMAEGIVADDIYDMIDENLVDSPHLELDLTTVGTMAIVTVEVETDEVSDVLDAVAEVLEGEGQQQSTLDIDISTDGDLATITIIEKIGQGESQVLP